MKKLSAVFAIFSALVIYAGEWKDIPYYEKDATAQGDVAYRNERCKLDLYTPPKRKNFPTIVWFHGGGLSRGGKKRLSVIDHNTIGVATVNYRLSGKGASCPDYLYDAAAAVAWVIKNIEKYGGNPNLVYVSGQSAGGYLSAMLALDKRYLNTFGIKPAQLAGVFPVTGQMSTHFQILKERKKKDPSTPDFLIDEYAPIYHAGAKEVPPMTFFAGDSELDWPARVEENQLLVMRMRRVYKNEQVKFYSIPGTNHGGCSRPSLAIINNILAKVIKMNSQVKK